MNICFLMYPWDKIVPENDTSLALIKECVKRGHGVALCTPANLTIRNSVTNAFCTVIGRMDKVPGSLKSFYKQAKLREEMLPLAGFDVIFMRANPPLDPIMLNFLDSVKDDVFIVNSLQGLREANNKLYTAAFGDSHSNIIPSTHVSKNKEYLIRQIKESKADNPAGLGRCPNRLRADRNSGSRVASVATLTRRIELTVLCQWVLGISSRPLPR